MKELSQEEKAKAYDEAVREASIAYKDEDRHLKATLERIFQELKESNKEERIIRSLKEIVTAAFSIEPQGVLVSINELKKDDLIAWLEKQGQKETTYDEDMLGAIEYCKKNNRPLEKEHIAWLEKQSEQERKTTDKFHEGDWIVVRDVVYHIDKISGVYLTLSTLDGTALVYHISILDSKHTHLYTIRDAKPSDILATEDWIFIFKEIKSNGKPVCYCHYDIELGFHIDTNSYIATGSEIYPATKEQRDKLEKAMADAGYTFDFKKNKLNKLEQSSAWSEEDEKKRKGLIKGLEDRMGFGWACDPFSREEYIDWLKSLKDRVRPQNTWKPSDKQMNALDSTLQYSQVSHNSFEYLNSLFNDLKKLREE